MTKKVLQRTEVLSSLVEKEKKVLITLGKHQDNICTIRDLEHFHNYVSACISTGIIAIDTETNNSLDPLTCNLMGLCLYAPGLQYSYVPINHRNPATRARVDNQLTERDVKNELQRVLDSGIKIVMHNGKFDYEVLKCTCDICVVPYWDTMIATRLLNENEGYGLKYQYTAKIDNTQEKYNIEELFDGIQYADVKPEIFALYSATDAYMTYKLYEYQLPLMKQEKKIFNLFMNIEMPLVTVVAEMELCGAWADLDYCQKLKEKYEAKLKAIDDQLNDELLKLKPTIERWKKSASGLEKERVFPPENARRLMSSEKIESRYPLFDPALNLNYKHGKTFASQLKDPVNLSSPKQLAILLYSVLDAPKPKKTKIKPNATGKSAIVILQQEAEKRLKEHYKCSKMSIEELDEDSNKKLLDRSTIAKYESVVTICKLLSERRMVDKLITTYLNPIPKLAQHWKDGKVRFKYNQLGARTGRFTSGGVWKFYDNETPITIKGLNGQNLPAENHEIRLMFKADPGRVFVGGDISQQEPKITAHISQDENMIRVYEEGKDIYASIAQIIYHNNYEDNLEFKDKEKKEVYLEGKKRRKTGKTIILATMYGMGPNSVKNKINKGIEDEQDFLSEDGAKEMLDTFYSQYTGVKKAIDYTIASCKKYGFVEDICGRKRRLPSIQLPPYQTVFTKEPSREDMKAEKLLKTYLEHQEKLSKEELQELREKAKANNIAIISNEEYIKKAERQSFNARIQGGAASLTKMIMVMVARDPLIKKLGGRIVFQIHDELIMDCPIENAEKVKNRLQSIMERSSTAVEVVLPMKCDMITETRWGEDTMTSELKEAYQKLIKKNVDNPLDKLCEEFCNFPEESIRQIICGDSEVLKFEW